MARGFPSMTALLALVAVAGYQNRDKIAEMLRGHNAQSPGQGRQQDALQQGGSSQQSGLQQGSWQQGGLSSVLGNIGGSFGGTGTGGFLGNGLRELVERFQQNGRGDVAQSWVSRGPNKEIAPHELESAIGNDVLADLSQRTGLSKEELLNRLSRELPTAVDKYTPEGEIPANA